MCGQLVQRKTIRYKGYDYRLPGYYFVTIRAKDKQSPLSSISCSGIPELTEIGSLCKNELTLLEERFPEISVDCFVIMPDHIHMLLRFSGISGVPGKHALSTVLSSFKVSVQNRCVPKRSIFQRSFYDHVIRGEREYLEIKRYILENPSRWLVKHSFSDSSPGEET